MNDNAFTEEQIDAESWERFPALDPEYASLTYPAEAMRMHNRSAFASGASWAAALSASASTHPADEHHDAEERPYGAKDVVHFAPYGGTNAACDETVPRGALHRDAGSGVYSDPRFTDRRAETTCHECQWRANIHPSKPAPSSEREAEGEDHAATVTGDRELVASVLREHRPSQWRSFNNDTIVYRCCGQDFGRLTGKPRKSDRDPLEQWEEHASQVLVDRLRGEGR